MLTPHPFYRPHNYPPLTLPHQKNTYTYRSYSKEMHHSEGITVALTSLKYDMPDLNEIFQLVHEMLEFCHPPLFGYVLLFIDLSKSV